MQFDQFQFKTLEKLIIVHFPVLLKLTWRKGNCQKIFYIDINI
jgi:hypothetical protein